MTRPAPIIAGTLAALLLLFGAYMGSYYLNLKPAWKQPPGWIGPPRPRTAPWELPGYRLEGEAVECFYWPAYQLDQRVRPYAH